MLRTLRYITLLSVCWWCCCAGLSAQEKPAEKKPAEEEAVEEKLAVYQGIMVEVDAFSAVASAFQSGRYSFEGNVRVNLLDKYFPVVEVGVAGADRVSVNDYGFKANGFFAKVGVDYNLLKPNLPDTRIHRYFLIGVRYAFSPFAYDVTNVWIDNGYWGEGERRDYWDVQTTKHWLEVVAGLRVEVFRNVYFGLGGRLKIQLGKEKEGEVSPWFIPGIGIKSIGNWGFNYTVGYRF